MRAVTLLLLVLTVVVCIEAYKQHSLKQHSAKQHSLKQHSAKHLAKKSRWFWRSNNDDTRDDDHDDDDRDDDDDDDRDDDDADDHLLNNGKIRNVKTKLCLVSTGQEYCVGQGANVAPSLRTAIGQKPPPYVASW